MIFDRVFVRKSGGNLAEKPEPSLVKILLKIKKRNCTKICNFDPIKSEIKNKKHLVSICLKGR